MADEMVIAEAQHMAQPRPGHGLTSWLAIILGQHGFSVVKSILFITTITLGGIPGFYTAALLLERIGREPTTALFLSISAWSCLYAYTPELYPTRARSTGAGMASAFGRVGAITGSIVVGYIIGPVGDPAYLRSAATGTAATAGLRP